MSDKSPRQRLLQLVGGGELRYALEGKPGWDTDVVDLLVAVAMRYCEPRRQPRKVRRTQ